MAETPARLVDALAHICRTLDQLAVAYALVGGLAVSARAEPRTTRDVDLAVAVPDDEAAETLIRALAVTGYRVATVIEHVRTGRLATIRLSPPRRSKFVVDLLFASCGIESEIAAGAERLEVLPGLVIPVARASHLIAMKLLARNDRERPQDADDIRALLAVTRTAERRRVAPALATITKRGYARGRDLAALWRTAQRESRSSKR